MTAGRMPIAGHKASVLLALVFALLTLSLYTPVMLWVGLLLLCTVMVRLALYWGWYHSVPSQRTINLLAVLAAVTLAWFSLGLGLLLSMINLLVMACALKLMLMSKRRDFLQLFISALFLTGCGFIFHQSMWATLFYSATLVLLLLALAMAFSPNVGVGVMAKRLLIQGMQTAPIAIVLFLVLPQLSPLWQMPSSRASTTGLSESVTPGDIASLAQSTDLAFNATFTGPVPAPQERYWRAITLEQFDGKTWTVSPQREIVRRQYQQVGHEFTPQLRGPRFDYQVIAEATGQRWLYAIDVAVPADEASRDFIWQGADYQLIAQQPLMSKRAYQVFSYPQTPMNQTLDSIDRRINLQVPGEGNPQTRQWVTAMRKRYPANPEFVTALMNFFATQGFSYTLYPQPMPSDPIDQFLFKYKAGFCAHYASALAYSLRLAGLPARMVTGYQGGESLSGNVLSIYQYDAHAWVEVQLDERGWIRLDPTRMVAPSRVEFGIQQMLQQANEDNAQHPLTSWRQWPVLSQIRHYLANMNYYWSRWVLGFNAQTQRDLLKHLLGELTPQRLSLFFLSIIAIISGLLAVYFLPRWKRQHIAPHTKIYLQAVNTVATYTGVVRGQLPARAYVERTEAVLPPVAATQFAKLSVCFEAIEYRPANPSRKDVQRAMRQHHVLLKRALKRASPAPTDVAVTSNV